MDLYKELNRLPYFFYSIGDDFKLLGGQQSKPDKPMSFNMIYDLWRNMMDVHQKELLNDEDKIYLGKSMIRMQSWCKGKDIKQVELQEYLDNLSENHRAELEKQIRMYKDARTYYSQYIY